MRTSNWLGTLLLLGCGMAPSLTRTGASSSSDSDAGPTSQLTAGIWDDTLNPVLFTTFRDAQQDKLADFTAAEQDAAAAAAANRAPTSALDFVLLVDSTGSMGDEISWLQTEFRAIADRVQAAHPGVPQRWALVHYRDDGDDYVVRHAEFTSDRASFQAALATLSASGGGDFPEAPDQALERAATLSWDTTTTTAKLVFWVADAPPHDAAVARFSASVRALRDRGVHLYPVASSGIDQRTEYAMRASAQLTLGRYLFLTDDSGVGESHLEPSVPCYVVTKLDHAVARVIASELAGSRVVVDPAQVIRSVGNPVDGQCALQSGGMATIF